MSKNIIISNSLWNKLPDDIKFYIFDIIFKSFDNLENILNFTNLRLLCQISNQSFEKEFIELKNRLECRESMCSQKLAKYCFYGRYCSLQCYYEHIMY